MKDMNVPWCRRTHFSQLLPLFLCRSMPQSQDVFRKDGSVRPGSFGHAEWGGFSSVLPLDVRVGTSFDNLWPHIGEIVGMASDIFGQILETNIGHLDAQLWTWTVFFRKFTSAGAAPEA